MRKLTKIFTVTVLSVTMVLTSCLKTDFDDETFYTLEEAVENTPDYALKVTTGAVQSVMFSVHNLYGSHLLMFADQVTSTNRFTEFWDFAQEPRKSVNNTTSYGGYAVTNQWFQDLNNANLNANIVIDLVETKGIPALDVEGNDRSQDVLAAIYFVKGVSQGYLGLIYDRGIVVNSLSGTPGFPNSYAEMIESAMDAFDKALQYANANPDLEFDFMGPSIPVSRADFIKMVNSYAARILASVPRSEAEAEALGSAHWDRVIAFANAGFTTDYTWPADPNIWWNDLMDWTQYKLSDGAGYLPVDIKVAWIVNNTHPKYYPLTNGVVLPQVESDDDRFYDYFAYDPDFGFLRQDRNRGLFTNYLRTKWDPPSNQMYDVGVPNPVVVKDEMAILKADAQYFKGDYAAAAATLNTGTNRKTLSGLPDVAATKDAVEYALHREFAIEIDNTSGAGAVWAFMRRHDLLIGGTPTQLPLPQQQLQLVGEDLYTFGGVGSFGALGKFGEVATAANNGWKASQ